MNINELDRGIIYELDSDSRQSLSSIAKKLKISQQRLKYRMELLIKNNVILDFISFIDVTRLGLYPFRVYFQYSNVDPAKEKEIVDYLVSNKYMQWIGLFSGGWDVEIVMFARNFFHYKEMMDEFMGKYGEHIRDKILSVSINTYYFKRRYLVKKKYPTTKIMNISRYGGQSQTVEVDDIDLKLLKILAKNARATLIELSNNVGITPNGVKDRLRRLRKNGVLQEHTILLNTKKIGYEFYKILVNMRGFNKELESRIVSFCDKYPNIWFFIICDGKWNVEFEIEVKGSEELRKLLMEFRNEFKDLVLNYETLLVYDIPKMTYYPEQL